jgi:cytidylate kinase
MKSGKVQKIIIAVDGPSSSGKSTFAKAIARELGYLYIDSGAMYRACTLFCLRNKIICGKEIDHTKLMAALPGMVIEFRAGAGSTEMDTYLNGENVEKEIRTLDVSSHVSDISVIREVRSKMVELQRRMASNRGVVMDGRDIGTVVFPDAELKIFLVADEKARARRRYEELVAKGEKVAFSQVLNNIIQRDRIDSTREVSPLRRADDAVLLDNSHMSVEEQMTWFREIYQQLHV